MFIVFIMFGVSWDQTLLWCDGKNYLQLFHLYADTQSPRCRAQVRACQALTRFLVKISCVCEAFVPVRQEHKCHRTDEAVVSGFGQVNVPGGDARAGSRGQRGVSTGCGVRLCTESADAVGSEGGISAVSPRERGLRRRHGSRSPS